MPDWLSTDNIAIGILLAGYIPAGMAIKTLWVEVKDGKQREIRALREGIDLDRSYAAQLDSMAAVQSSMQRTQASGTQALVASLGKVEKAVHISADRVIQELKPLIQKIKS